MTLPTILDIAKANGSDGVVGLIDETIAAVPELRLGFARTIKGQNFKTLVRTALPTVSFRDANEGVTASKATYENRLVQTYILNPRFECDKAVADKYEDGATAYIAMENEAVLQAAMVHTASQFYYGVSNDAKGFPGLLAALDPDMVVDAAGTTANTGSSVWGVKFGPKHAGWVWGEGGEMALPDPRIETLTDADNKKFTGYVTDFLAYPGVHVGNRYSIARIKKLTEDAGKGLTDDLIFQMLAKFPAGITPDVLLMTRRSQEQLRKSRTATNATGAPAPTPTDVGGIPIEITDSIKNNESLTL